MTSTLHDELTTLMTAITAEEPGWRRESMVEKFADVLNADATRMVAEAELIRATIEATTLGVDLSTVERSAGRQPEPWWSNPWAVVSAAAVAISPMVVVGLVFG